MSAVWFSRSDADRSMTASTSPGRSDRNTFWTSVASVASRTTQLDAEPLGGLLRLLQCVLGARVLRVDEREHALQTGDELRVELEVAGDEIARAEDAREVRPWAGEALDQAAPNGVRGVQEDDRGSAT